MKQEFQGPVNQVAGRDVINIVESYTPDQNNPRLMNCVACGLSGVSKTANECPRCGHDFVADRVRLAESKRLERATRNQQWAMFSISVLFLSVVVSEKAGISFWQALPPTFAAGLFLWYGLLSFCAWVKNLFR